MILNKNILIESILDDEEVQASSMKTTDLGELVGDAVGDEYSDYEFYANIVYTYNKLYKQLENEIEPAVRLDLLKKMQQILIGDGVAIVDGYYNSCMVWNSKTVATAHIRPNDYYWVTTEITPVA